MDHSTTQNLIRKGVRSDQPQIWADLGCGSGTFTRSIATLLPMSSKVLAVDNNAKSLKQIPEVISGTGIRLVASDFTTFEPEEALDGILMANSIHFVKNKADLINRLFGFLNENGVLILVEYDTNHGNPWVPHPISYDTLCELISDQYSIEKIGEASSRYQRSGIYSALITGSTNK